MNIERILQKMANPLHQPKRDCPSDQDLALFAENTLSDSERQRVLSHLSTCASCLAAVTLIYQEEPSMPDDEQAVERAKNIIQVLPIASLKLGLARQGIKILSGHWADFAPDLGRLRLQRVPALGPLASRLAPLGSNLLRFLPGKMDLSLSLDVRSREIQSELHLPATATENPAVQVDFYEDGVLLFSDAVPSSLRLELPRMEINRTYHIELSSPLPADFTLDLEPIEFTTTDVVILCLYHLASGQIREAARLWEEELPSLELEKPLAFRFATILPRFVSLFPSMKILLAQPAQRVGQMTIPSEAGEMEISFRRVLVNEVPGKWSELVPTGSGTLEQWKQVHTTIKNSLAADPSNETLIVIDTMLEAWLQSGRQAGPVDSALSAIGQILTGTTPENDKGSERH